MNNWKRCHYLDFNDNDGQVPDYVAVPCRWHLPMTCDGCGKSILKGFTVYRTEHNMVIAHACRLDCAQNSID